MGASQEDGSNGFQIEKTVHAKALRWEHGIEGLRNNKKANVTEAEEAR